MLRQQIINRMHQKGLTQIKTSRLAGLNHMTICKFFAGKGIRLDTFLKILDALDLEMVIQDR